MQITSRFAIAMHILACIEYFGKDYAITSSFLAGSIGANPVIVRTVMGELKNAGLIAISQGKSGITLAKPLKEISLYDIYKAAEPLGEQGLFRFHKNPNANCPIGRNIHKGMQASLKKVQDAMERSMKSISAAHIYSLTKKEIIKEGKQNE